MAHACNPLTWAVEAGETEARGYPQLHSELEAKLGDLGSCTMSK